MGLEENGEVSEASPELNPMEYSRPVSKEGEEFG